MSDLHKRESELREAIERARRLSAFGCLSAICARKRAVALARQTLRELHGHCLAKGVAE